MSKKINKNEAGGLKIVKNAGYTATRKVKKDKTVNRRAGLHDKAKNLEGEVRVKRRKPLGIKHVRRMRKFAAVATVGVVGSVAAVIGVGFFSPSYVAPVDDVGNPTVCFELPTDGSKPTGHTILENVGYLSYVLKHQTYWSSSSTTNVDAVALGIPAKQSVDNFKQYYDGVLISADLSFSGVSESLQYGEQFCQYNGVILSRYSTSNKTEQLKKGLDAPWSTGEATGWKEKGFRENRGLPPLDFSVYVLNEKTVANAYDTTVVDNGNGTYSMTLELNVNTGDDETSADYYYKLQMQANGNLNEKPTIYYTNLTYTFDENWRVLKLEVKDSYTAKAMGMNSDCTSHTITEYNYDESNAKNTFWDDYFKAEYDRLKDNLIDEEITDKEEVPTAMGYLTSAFGSVLTDGAIFKLGLAIDELDINGVIAIGMTTDEESGASNLSGLSAKLGDILVWLDGETLYINDGAAKYKLNIGVLTGGESQPTESEPEAQSLTDSLNLNALLNQLTGGEFVYDQDTGVATLDCVLELFGLNITLNFEFQKTEEGVDLNFLTAEIPVGEKVVYANLCFGTESDKPAIPEDTAGYQDIMNDGVTLNISVALNDLELDGVAKILMNAGEFAGVYATLGDFTVYYDCPQNMLYLSDGTAKYKLNLSVLNKEEAAALSLPASLDLKAIINEVLANLTTTESSLGTNLNINIAELESVLNAALNIQLSGGLKVNAGLTYNEKLNLSVSANLSNEEVQLPEFKDYQDILNGTVTLDVSITLLTGLEDEDGNRDRVTLSGKVALKLSGGELAEIRAKFGGIEVYYGFADTSLYLKIGTTKVMLDFAEMDINDTGVLSSFTGGNFISADLPTVIQELLNNLVAEGQIISTSVDLGINDEVVVINAGIDLTDGLGVNANLTLFGIDANATVKFSATELEGISEEEKAEYVDVLKEGQKVVESLIGSHISATVKGTLNAYDDKYAECENVKYTFEALLEYDKGVKSVTEEGVEADTKDYIHLNIGLTAVHPDDESLYLDLTIMDANPVSTGADGRTTGGYTQDGKYDIYLSVSKYVENAKPLLIYAPVDEIFTLVSMVGAIANLGDITVSEELTEAVDKIATLLDDMLISKYLPNSVVNKFASLGDSLIPQILGESLGDLLNGLFGTVDGAIQQTESVKISLADEYVSSITTTDETLKFVLNSALIYNNDNIGAEDGLTVTFERVLKDGVYFVGGVDIKNIYFGKNLANKLRLNLSLGYGEIERPSASTAFKDYMNADGLDTLLNGLVNSATHSKDIATDREKEFYGADLPDYILNHYYLLQGSVKANINAIGFINVDANIILKSVAVYIDEKTNDVSIDAHIYYDGVQELNQIAIEGDTDVYVSLRLGQNAGGGRIIVRKVQYTYWQKDGLITSEKYYDTPVEEVRSMTLKEFSDNLMDNLTFILSFGPIITDNIAKSGGGNGGINFDGYDYGQYLSAILAYYVSEETATGASWTVAVNGGLLTELTGMTMSNIPVKFTAVKDSEGAYTVTNLDILKSTMQLFGNVVKLELSGGFTYCNPQGLMGDYTDTSDDLFNMDVTVESKYPSPYIESVFTAACGSLVKLPLEVVAESDGQKYMLVGYTSTKQYGGTANVAFESYVEENGVKYGLVKLTSDTAYTAIWDKAYTVTFNDENGNVLSTVVYRNGDILNFGNMPACPERDGYTSQWVGADGSEANGVSVTGDASFKVEYKKAPFIVTFNSTINFNYTGYDGNYKTIKIGFEEGTDYTLANATNADSYSFLGWWYQDGANWRKLTSVEELVQSGLTSVTLEALWIKVDASCTTTRDTYRKNVFSTLYYYYYIEGEVAYSFEGNSALIDNITCTGTNYTMYYSNKKGSTNYPYTFDGYQNKLEQQKVTLTDSWDSAKYDSWKMVVTLTFNLPDGTVQIPTELTGNY